MVGKVDRTLAEPGYTLPAVPPQMGNYVPFVITSNLLYTSGLAPRVDYRESRG